MRIDVTELSKKIVFNARPGGQTLKIIEIIEKLDEARMEYEQMIFVNQWGEYHTEKFYPERHAEKLYELACAFSDAVYREGETVEVDTSDFVGNYFYATLTNVELKHGEISDAMFIRDIRVSPKRKDLSGSRYFKRPPRRKKNK